MRNVTKDNITDVFMSYMAEDSDPRTREIMGDWSSTCTTSPAKQTSPMTSGAKASPFLKAVLRLKVKIGTNLYWPPTYWACRRSSICCIPAQRRRRRPYWGHSTCLARRHLR